MILDNKQVIYFWEIYKYIDNCGGNTRVINLMFGKVYWEMHRFILNIQIGGGNLADFDDNQHTN